MCVELNTPKEMTAGVSLEDILFSLGDDGSVAVPFDKAHHGDPSDANVSVAGGHYTNMSSELDTVDLSLFDGCELGWHEAEVSLNQNESQAQTTDAGMVPSAEVHIPDLDFLDLDLDLDFPYLQPPPQDCEVFQEDQAQRFNVNNGASFEQFFFQNGASRPPAPCSHCARLRLQCVIIQTTSANPNPIMSCSSCVALFRECSLSGRGKRSPLAFETAEPVIGQLHGVNEDVVLEEGEQSEMSELFKAADAPTLSTMRPKTKPVKKTRVLRNWFACHMDHPYPSEEEKISLAKQSGLSKTQVINWFTNTRRRHRLTSQHYRGGGGLQLPGPGSPMPQSIMSGMSPMERWRNSPPHQEPASESAIENALLQSEGDFFSLDNFHLNTLDGGASSTSGESFLYNNTGFQDASSNSASSVYSSQSSAPLKPFSLSAHSSWGEGPSSSWTKQRRPKSVTGQVFQCTFCKQTFKKKYDWVRHERSIHLPSLDAWVCSIPVPPDQPYQIWRINQTQAECIFCGEPSPSGEHIASHEFEACTERPVADRTFTRKDHLWQHLNKFHGCRKWPGWAPNLSLLQHRRDVVRSRCGFCGLGMERWEERMKHVAGHFKAGATMEAWKGGCGVEGFAGQSPGIM